jgi:hypothetical protein
MFDELMQYYLSQFHERGEQAVIDICNLDVPSQIVLMEYTKLPPIETMSEDHKKEMKQYIIETFPDKSVEQKVKCAKIFYTVGTMLS